MKRSYDVSCPWWSLVARDYMVGTTRTLHVREVLAMADNLDGTCCVSALSLCAMRNELPPQCLAKLHQSATKHRYAVDAIYASKAWQKHHVRDMWGDQAPTTVPKHMKNLKTLLEVHPDFRRDATGYILRALAVATKNPGEYVAYYVLDLVKFVATEQLTPYLPGLVRLLALPGACVGVGPVLRRFAPVDLVWHHVPDICGVKHRDRAFYRVIQRRLVELTMYSMGLPQEVARHVGAYY